MTDNEIPERKREDKWGVVIQRQSGNGRWYNWKRIAKDGTEFLLYKSKTEDYLSGIKSCKVKLAINEMNGEMMFNDQLMTDNDEARLLNALQDKGLKGVGRMRNAMQEAGYNNRFHPLIDYLKGLTWDGQDHIGALLEHFTFDGDDAWSRTVIKKWLVGSVAKIFEQAQLFMLVLDGPQGCGKSHWVYWLCPDEKFFVEGAIVPGLKDTDLTAIGKWIWEVSELQSTTRKADREALKAHITKKLVTVRAPYGRYAITKPVTACYIGTINQDAGFLEDDSGNRRFVITKVRDMDWKYSKAIDVDQIWAQAVHLYEDGMDWELSADEAAHRDSVNKEYDAPHPVVELFLEYYSFESEAGESSDDFIPTMNIVVGLEEAGLKGNQWGHMMKLTSWLKSQDVTYAQVQMDGKRQRGFYGVWQKKPFPGGSYSANGSGPTSKVKDDTEEVPF